MRSGLEKKVAASLKKNKIKASYEKDYLKYVVPERNATYNPDFTLSNGIYIEVKGKLDATTRRKMKLVREHNPDADIRFIFDLNNKLRKGGKMRYARWCELNGFPHYCFIRPNKDLGQDRDWTEILMEWANEDSN